MDPQAVLYRFMRSYRMALKYEQEEDQQGTIDALWEAAESAHALFEWLAKGGSAPAWK